MGVKLWRMAGAGAATSALLGLSMVVSPTVASAATAVPWTSAAYQAYASGDEIHLGAVTVPVANVNLATLDEAFTGATANSSGLTAQVTDPETGTLIQPAKSAADKSYGRGDGLEVGLGTTTPTTNQIDLLGPAESTAPPNGAAVTKQIGPVSIPPVASASAVTGHAASFYSADACPLGQPLSYGEGDLAGASALTFATGANLVDTPGNGAASSTSDDYLSSNGDGTFGMSSEVAESVAPAALNLLNLFTLNVTVQGADPSAPITWTAKATGEGSGASMTLGNAGVVNVTLGFNGTTYTVASIPLSSVGPSGTTVPLDLTNISGLVSNLTGVLANLLASNSGILAAITGPLGSIVSTLGGTLSGSAGTVLDDALATALGAGSTLSLGSISIGTRTTSITQGTSASGYIDLAKVNIAPDISFADSGLGAALSGPLDTLFAPLNALTIANLEIGHMMASASTAAPISCPIPMTKTSDPTAVTAGNTFTSHILVPDPSDGLACNLTGLTVTDTITDYQGSPTFTVTSASNGGTIKTVSPTQAVVTWTGLSWTAGDPPLDLQVQVSVPKTSPSGVIQDDATSQATASGCSGGTSGVTGIDDGVTLTGTAHLAEPSVTALAAAADAAGPSAAANPLKSGQLPFTGAMGGFWQPIAGIGMLGAGAGGLALVRRARRLPRA